METKVLSIGSDRNLFVNGSEAQKRIKEYGKLFNELHIVVFSRRNGQIPRDKMQISDNIWAYPTYSKSKWLYIWDAYKIAKLLVVGRGLSVITAQDPFESGLVGWLLKRKHNLPLQLQIHTDIFSPYFWRESLLNRMRVLMAKFLLPRADGIRVVSERIKNSIIENCKLKIDNSAIVVLPIYVDVKKIQSAKVKVDLHKKYPDYDFIILMASRLTKEKNIGLAIEAMKDVLSPQLSTLNPLLLIVGDGPECKTLQELIVKGQLLNVIIEPAVDSVTLFSYYKTADLFLLTSNYEGYGRTVIEAMAAGCPVVMTDVGLAGELLVDELDGLVVPVGDKPALIGAIRELIRNKEKRNGLVAESQKIINSLPEKKEYLDNYKDLLNI